MFGITVKYIMFLIIDIELLGLYSCSGFSVKKLGIVTMGTVWKAVCQFR
jgi:hypothetical protein